MLDTFRHKLAKALMPKHRSFDAANLSSRFPRQASMANPAQAGLQANPQIRNRARYIEANNPHAHSGVAALTASYTGSGITPAVKHSDKAVRRLYADTWAEFVSQADADETGDLYGLQAQMVRAMLIDGESFAIANPGPSGLQFRVIPAEQVDESKTQYDSGNRIVSGIEFDRTGRRVAYWVFPEPPTLSVKWSPSVRVPASAVIHLYPKQHPGQIRGISSLAPVLLRLNEIDRLEDAILMGFKTAALHAGFYTDVNGVPGLPYEGEQDGSTLISHIEPGTLTKLPPGADIRFSSPQQAQSSVDYLQSQLRAVSAGMGVPEFILTNDCSRANYSSLRASLIAYRQRVETIQFTSLIPQMCKPMWDRFTTHYTLLGRLPHESLPVEFYPPAVPAADDIKAVQADVAAIQAGLKSRAQAVAERGYSVENLDDEIAADTLSLAGEQKGI